MANVKWCEGNYARNGGREYQGLINKLPNEVILGLRS